MRLRIVLTSLLLGLLFQGTGYSQTRVDALGGSSDAAQGVFDRIGGNANTVAPIPPVRCEYPKGMEAYLKENVHYPRSEYDAGSEGKVYVEFVVNEEGNVQDVKVVHGVSPGLDAEAVRAVKSMPKLTSDRMDGQPVGTRYVIPVAFVLGNVVPPAED